MVLYDCGLVRKWLEGHPVPPLEPNQKLTDNGNVVELKPKRFRLGKRSPLRRIAKN